MKTFNKLAKLKAALLSLLVGSIAWGQNTETRANISNDDSEGHYTVCLDKPAQIIWGLGFEIQSDSLNKERLIGIPHDLVSEERQRFYHDMLKGFRYCRLALGLYLRGTDADGKHIQERYPNQMKDLLELQRESGIEGFEAEYWSPTPYWKSTDSYVSQDRDGTLKSFDENFLNQMGEAMVQDVKYLQTNGLRVVQWGLQNEPETGKGAYAKCLYRPEDYFKTFKIVAPKIRTNFPGIKIHASSSNWFPEGRRFSELIAEDPQVVQFVDLWTWHCVGTSSDIQINQANEFNARSHDKPVFNNEFEYLSGGTSDDSFVNTAQSVMNWMVFENSPTFTWLHALKPTDDRSNWGFGLGFWRPPDDENFMKFNLIMHGHWDYNPQNFNALAGFLNHMPWDSRRIVVQEDRVRMKNRIMAYRTPAGKLVVVLTNRLHTGFTFHLDTGLRKHFQGYRYTPQKRGLDVGTETGQILNLTVPGQSVEFWVEQ